MTKIDLIADMAPTPQPFDPDWSEQTLLGILATDQVAPARKRRGRRVALAGLAAGALTVGTAAAVASGGPDDVVRRVLTQFSEQPNTSGNGLGVLHDPELVAQFESENGIFAFWVATSSSGTVCYALSDGQWDGTGTPTKDQLEYGCGGQLWMGPNRPLEHLTRPDQLGGFFAADVGLVVYGVSPYPRATEVIVEGDGVDRTLPVRADSLGYGDAFPEASQAASLTLTFLDAGGQALGSKRVVAPVG